jgi:carboxypeptidase C (cathepsin A)
MKVILEFNLPEDAAAYNTHIKADYMQCAIKAMTEYLRSEVKYNEGYSTAEKDILVQVRERFHEILSEYGVDNLE